MKLTTTVYERLNRCFFLKKKLILILHILFKQFFCFMTYTWEYIYFKWIRYRIQTTRTSKYFFVFFCRNCHFEFESLIKYIVLSSHRLFRSSTNICSDVCSLFFYLLWKLTMKMKTMTFFIRAIISRPSIYYYFAFECVCVCVYSEMLVVLCS